LIARAGHGNRFRAELLTDHLGLLLRLLDASGRAWDTIVENVVEKAAEWRQVPTIPYRDRLALAVTHLADQVSEAVPCAGPALTRVPAAGLPVVIGMILYESSTATRATLRAELPTVLWLILSIVGPAAYRYRVRQLHGSGGLPPI
jgi:hypothetical protein